MEALNMSLPPGFRFHPTDEELIVHYLNKKVSSSSTNPLVSIVAEINLYKFNPWELPERAFFGENEWFFFSPRDRKYPNGSRPNRAAASGYWKATGTDKPILSSNASQRIGVKKALVFYRGRPPKGTKTNWMMYEYRLLNDSHGSLRLRGSMRLDDWVLCRIRQKGNIVRERQENPKNNNTGTSSSYDLGYFEQDLMEKISYFNYNNGFAPWESEVVDEHGHLEFQGGTSNSYSQTNRVCSMNDALETIRRVLSLGALDEQIPLQTNKKSCSLTSSNSDNSGIFELSSS
ncbi:unnamed protein product [Ilex paraguariensis]|uniref:NAC domain-containing protein n=1 Tax=Ilex paraguariensis TaxID=185542 RepID=A0ABC8S5Q5_9AQUA